MLEMDIKSPQPPFAKGGRRGDFGKGAEREFQYLRLCPLIPLLAGLTSELLQS